MRLAISALAMVSAVSWVTQSFWVSQSTGLTTRLRGVSAVTDKVAWTSGAQGAVLRTVDGGHTWQRLKIAAAESLDFRDIDAFNDRVAYTLSIGPGEASRIYKTTDGGSRWNLQFINRDLKAFFDAMAFWNEDRGIALSDSVESRFVFLMTNDGGRRWAHARAEGLPPALPNEGFFAASGTNVAVFGTDHVWAGTTAGRVLRSTDRGRTWNVSTTPVGTGSSAGIFSIAFRDANHGIVVGGDYKKETEAVDNAAVTSDGGATWTLVTGLSGFRSAVAYIPGAKTPSLLAVGPQGADYSNDDGHTWTRVDGPGFDTVSFASGGTIGWAAGALGRVARIEASALPSGQNELNDIAKKLSLNLGR